MPVDPLTARAGYYGKLPTRGDFLTRGLAPSFVTAMDSWLQQAIATSQAKLGDAWLQKYLGSPFWRYALSAGACGDTAHIGILMPSVDNVGRYFPLVVAYPVADDSNFINLIERSEAWFDSVEQLALDALDNELDPEQLAVALERLPLPEPGEPDAIVDAEYERWRSFRYPASTSPKYVVQKAYALSLRDQKVQASCWWTSGADSGTPNMLCGDGMPDPNRYVAMLGFSEFGDASSNDSQVFSH